MPEITGRVWGYADEVDWFCRQMDDMVALVHIKNPRSRVAFVRVGSPLHLGTRGWFNKRNITKQEYRIVMDSAVQYPAFNKFLSQLRDRMS